MRKLVSVAFLLSALNLSASHAAPIFLSLDGAAQKSERTIMNRLQSSGFEVAPFSTMNGQSGVILHMVSVIDRNTTGQGNLIANHGGGVTAIYMCETKAARMPIFIGALATTGVSLGDNANNIDRQAEVSLVQTAAQVLKRSTAKIEEWATYCANANSSETSTSEPPTKKKKK